MSEAKVRAVGVVACEELREHLSKTPDAKAAIISWVAQNSLDTPSCQPAHELLDWMGFSRAYQHKGIMTHMKDRLLARIDTLPQDKKLALLEQCFPFISIPELRAVPVEILSKLQRIPRCYICEISKDGRVMSELPLALRRQVWAQKVNPELFKSYILPIIRQYALHPQVLGLVTGFKSLSAKIKKARAANKPLQDILAACADIAPLYRETLDIIGQAYLDNPNDLALCSLRLQLPLAALEAGFKHVTDTDPCYKLAKCLADAARDKDVKEAVMLKTLTEAHDLAKSLRPLQTAMLLRAPETSEYVTSSLVAACRRVAANESIPKHDTVLNVGSRLLKWSSMQKLHHHTSFPSSPHLVTPLLEEFYPALLVCMVDDLLREGQGECEPLEPTLDTLTASHAEARALVLQYMQDCVSTEAVDSSRFLSLMPLYKTAAIEAAAAAADMTPDTADQSTSVSCIYVTEETRRLASIARRLLERQHKDAAGAGAQESCCQCIAALLPTLIESLRDGCSVGAIVCSLALADFVAASGSPPPEQEMEAHVQVLCDAAQRADTVALSKSLSMAASWLSFDVPTCYARLGTAVPKLKDELASRFAPAAKDSADASRTDKMDIHTSSAPAP